jgi:hypothetical protein
MVGVVYDGVPAHKDEQVYKGVEMFTLTVPATKKMSCEEKKSIDNPSYWRVFGREKSIVSLANGLLPTPGRF